MKKIIHTTNAPEPIGPYNQAVWAGELLFVSGQIPIDPANGELKNASAEEATMQVMNNVKAILSEANLTFENVVKSSIFVLDLNDFKTVNEVYGSFFEGNFPARETVQVANLPMGSKVEISVIASK